MNITPFKELMLRTCGHSFEKEREKTLSEGLCRRMAALDIVSYETYHALLLCDQDELLRLTELMTVNETYFFREPAHLNMMVDTLVPEFMTPRNQRPVRIVSAGCSTGEEPYSIAILLRERFGAASEKLFSITGVDIDSTVIGSAKQGVYGKSSFRGMNHALLGRYFEPCGSGSFQVSDVIRKQVGFEVVNLLGASYPPRMQKPDIILYRNVSIYFPQQVQRDIFGKLAKLLADGGCMLVGASETIHHDIGILSLVKQDSLFFYRKIPSPVFEERRSSSRHITTLELPRGRVQQCVPVDATVSVAHKNMKKEEGAAHAPPRKNPHVSTPPDVRKCFDEAIELAHNKQHDKALGILDAIIEQDSSFEKAYSLKGSLLLSLSRFDEARAVCEAILRCDSLCLEAYLLLGIIARQNGDDDDALKRFREALYLDPSCWLANFYTGEILFAHRDEKRARSCYEAVVRVLEKGSMREHGYAFFPLSFNAEQFIVICRHKLTLLTPADGKRATAGSSSPRMIRKTISSVPGKNG